MYNRPMLILRVLLAILVLPGFAVAQEHVSFPTEDGGSVFADMYGTGERGVLLAHGGRFNKESWGSQARELAKAGFRVLAIDFRGYGQSRGPQSKSGYDGVEYDVLAGVRYLHAAGVKTVSVVGASFGGEAAANASIDSEPGEIDRLVLLAGWTARPPEKIKGRKLFIVARDDAKSDGPRLPKIRANYEKAEGPKELIILDGSAHAQFIFAIDQGERLMREILRFLSQP
jgi:pimeloyl-ACP methyl ester carboxylesterase